MTLMQGGTVKEQTSGTEFLWRLSVSNSESIFIRCIIAHVRVIS